jgi:hypothetical protein
MHTEGVKPGRRNSGHRGLLDRDEGGTVGWEKNHERVDKRTGRKGRERRARIRAFVDNAPAFIDSLIRALTDEIAAYRAEFPDDQVNVLKNANNLDSRSLAMRIGHRLMR